MLFLNLVFYSYHVAFLPARIATDILKCIYASGSIAGLVVRMEINKCTVQPMLTMSFKNILGTFKAAIFKILRTFSLSPKISRSYFKTKKV